ncbi:MAG: hypothetical protein U0800_00095 [Isosphaeraceae bacterium]
MGPRNRYLWVIFAAFAGLWAISPAQGQVPQPRRGAANPRTSPNDEPPELPAPAELPVATPAVPAPPLVDDQVIPAADGQVADPGMLPLDGLMAGVRAVGLSVHVQADPVAYLNKETVVKVVVKNTGPTEARGVVVRDVLPEGLEFVAGLDAQAPERSGNALVWNLSSMAAGTERTLKYKAKPTRVGPLDHAATATIRVGSKARTEVKQPKLRVEIEPVNATATALRGDRVQFKVKVSNPGSGSARNVLIQARISTGLRHEEKSRSLDLTLEEIRSGDTRELAALWFDTIAGGPQFCEVSATSADVVPTTPEEQAAGTARAEVNVLEPKLAISIEGPAKAYTRMTAPYRLNVENPGTAPIDTIAVAIYIPEGGELKLKPNGSRYSSNDRNLRFQVPHLDPQQKLTYEFRVEMGAPRPLAITAAAKTRTKDRDLLENARFDTEIQGKADVRIKANERNGILDVGEIAEFEISLENRGTKEAVQVTVSAELTKNLKVVETDHDGDERAQFDAESGRLVFPVIPRMAPGNVQRILIRAKAVSPGLAKCTLALSLDGEEMIPFIAYTKVESLSDRSQK